MTAEKPGVGVTQEMIRAYAEGRAKTLKITVLEEECPQAVIAQIERMLVDFPTVGYEVMRTPARIPAANTIVFKKRS